SYRLFCFLAICALLTSCGGGGDGEASFNGEASFKPLAPEDFSSSVWNQSVTLEWQSSDDVDSYNLYYSTDYDMDVSSYAAYEYGSLLVNVESPLIIDVVDPSPIYFFFLTAVKDGEESLPSKPV